MQVFRAFRIFSALVTALVITACGGGATGTDVISRERFVAANVAVRSLPDGAPPARRAEALKKHRVTEKELRAWVTVHSRDPEMLAKTWEQIAFKLDSMGNVHPGAAQPGQPPVVPGLAPPPPLPPPTERVQAAIARDSARPFPSPAVPSTRPSVEEIRPSTEPRRSKRPATVQ